MNKKISVGIAVSLILIAVTITFTATMIFSMDVFDKKVSSAQERAAMYDKLSEIDKVARQNFYKEIDDTELFNSLAGGYMAGLGDADSMFLTSEQIAQRSIETAGSVVSIGITVEKNLNGYAVINNVVAESPADRMELKVGDVITKVDDQDVLAIGFDAAQEMLVSGTEGSKVGVTYNRDGTEGTAEVTRTTVEATTIFSSQIDDIFFIRIEKLGSSTLAQFKRAVAEAQANTTIKGVVFDVRDLNGGYDLSIVAEMLDILLPTGTLVSGTYAGDATKVLYTSDSDELGMPMAVLVNEGTVGFSELFAAVLGDSDKCSVVGSKTAGKGTLQQLIKLTDGSGVDITVATLNSPSGPFNETGVVLDHEVAAPEGFIRVSTPSETTDPQYKKAADAVRAM